MGGDRDQPNLFDLPMDVLSLILNDKEAGNIVEVINNLMRTSKSNELQIKLFLSRPDRLLQLFCKLSPDQLSQLIQTHFSPNSVLYEAIKNASLTSTFNNDAIVCFALMTDNINTRIQIPSAI